MYIKLNKGKCSGNIKIEILNIMLNKNVCRFDGKVNTFENNETFKDGGSFYRFIM